MEDKHNTVQNIDILLEDMKKPYKQNRSKTLFFLNGNKKLIEEYLKNNLSYSSMSKHIQKKYSKRISPESIRKFAIDELDTPKWKSRKPNKISITEKILKNTSFSFTEIYNLLSEKEREFLIHEEEIHNSISVILNYSKENFSSDEFKYIEDFLCWFQEKNREEDEEIIDIVKKVENFFLAEEDYIFSPNDIKYFRDKKTFLAVTKLLEKRNPHDGINLKYFAIDIRNNYKDYLSVIYD